MMEGITSTDTSEGGRVPPSQAKPWDGFCENGLHSQSFDEKSLFSEASQSLEGLKNSGIAW